MPILMVLMLAIACLPVPWPEPPFGLSTSDSAALTFAVMATPQFLAAAVSVWVVGTLRRSPDRRQEVLRLYSRSRRRLGYANLLAILTAIVGCGWGWTVWHTFTMTVGTEFPRTVLAPGAELLVPAPFFLTLLVGWTIYYPAERILHHTSLNPSQESFWSLPGYVLFNGRQFALLVLVPVILFAVQQGMARAYPGIVMTAWFQIASLVGVILLFVLLPRLVKPALGLISLPPGPERDSLQTTVNRLGYRFTDLLVWPTRGAVANAMVLGLIPQARYIVFTDRLLHGMEPDELTAVLGHELGHVRHRHIPYYAGFFAMSAAIGTGLIALLSEELTAMGWTTTDDWAGWLTVPPVAALGIYLFVVFGLLSRRCERQADIFGSRVGSCNNTRCTGHDANTIYPAQGVGLCPMGVRSMIRALDRVSALNGMESPATQRRFGPRVWAWMRAWQHGPMSDRIEFLFRLVEDVSLADRTDRQVNRFRVGLLLILFVTLGVVGSVVGWSTLWRML